MITVDNKRRARPAGVVQLDALVAGNRAEQERRAHLLRERLNTDPDYAAKDAARVAAHRNDNTLDPRLRAVYLDQTILDNQQTKTLFGVSIQAVWDWSAPVQADRRDRPHPRMSPEPDVILGRAFGGVFARDVPGVQAGKLIEWGVWTNRLVFDPYTGKIEKNTAAPRHGRPRRRKG